MHEPLGRLLTNLIVSGLLLVLRQCGTRLNNKGEKHYDCNPLWTDFSSNLVCIAVSSLFGTSWII